ncbi:MAG: valine--tRNA ligase [Candidatus Bathyarchaeia archaeon]
MAELTLPTRYDFKRYEDEWGKLWDRWKVNAFDRTDRAKPTYSIDTPPPYPSGEFHMGNALNWCYIDFVARYKRMRGFNVHFPQGWDCHGLPTEVRAEILHNVRKKDLPIEKFKELCIRLTEEYIENMKASMKRIGYSIDWSLEYRTMDPGYYRLTQLSFILLYRMGKLYRGEHPVNWCPRCETAIAEAEVEYITREGSLNYITFKTAGGGKLPIATTRPELLPACVAVAVHPDDDRYKDLRGEAVEVPLYGRRVPVIADSEVDPSFGTGVVMVCTFGDKTDVKWQKRHNLPVINVIGEDGRMTGNAGKYEGLTIEEARESILKALDEEGLIERRERLLQNIGTCWRCHTPIEILTRMQWFMKTLEMTGEVLEWAEKVEWIPEHAKRRLIDWATSLDWDWVISRQRIFATPIPVWYCKGCGEIIVAEEDWLPVDPRFERPKVERCPRCGSQEFEGEKDVMDTWMDSSITCAVHAGWPDDPEGFMRLFPADLQPNGLDIIRTWDYYLMVRHLALFGRAPYKRVLVNGMVRGADGRMMHKSYGNYVEAGEVLDRYGADALRQWAAAGGATGNDIPFKWSDLEYGRKFLTKLWNASRFILSNLRGYDGEPGKPEILDLWMLSKLERLIRRVTEAYESYQFNVALESLRGFTWHILCDQYLEAVKHRLYGESPVESRKAAQYTLKRVLTAVLKMLAPICPYITETLYQMLKAEDDPVSIHLTGWPTPREELIDEEAEAEGDILIEAISTLRRAKAEERISLREQVPSAVVKSSEPFKRGVLMRHKGYVAKVCKVEDLRVEDGEKELEVAIQRGDGSIRDRRPDGKANRFGISP